MSGFGAMGNMHKSNQKMLKRIKPFDVPKHYDKWDFKKRGKKKTSFKKASPELIHAIRKKNKVRKIKNTVISVLAFLISIVSVAYLTYYLFY